MNKTLTGLETRIINNWDSPYSHLKKYSITKVSGIEAALCYPGSFASLFFHPEQGTWVLPFLGILAGFLIAVCHTKAQRAAETSLEPDKSEPSLVSFSFRLFCRELAPWPLGSNDKSKANTLTGGILRGAVCGSVEWSLLHPHMAQLAQGDNAGFGLFLTWFEQGFLLLATESWVMQSNSALWKGCHPILVQIT